MLRLLLAEDNPADAMLVREALSASPVATDVLVAKDGEQALGYLQTESFDLVILDLNLPKVDGHGILGRSGNLARLPVIVVFTSSSNPVDRNRALKAGAKDYVVKPIGLEEFTQAVQDIVQRWSGKPK
jgi:DNA-binding response OmpR family regulator